MSATRWSIRSEGSVQPIGSLGSVLSVGSLLSHGARFGALRAGRGRRT